MHIKKEDFLKLPNILTYIRILLVPVFIYVFLNAITTLDFLLAGLIVVVSGLTDLFDGLIARRFHIITDLGKVLDPIADKLMQAAMFLCVIIRGWDVKSVFNVLLIISILFVIKEIVTFLVSAVLYKKGFHLDGSMWFGKACTVVIYLVMLTIIMVPQINTATRLILLLVAGLFLILAFTFYMYEYKKMYDAFKLQSKTN